MAKCFSFHHRSKVAYLYVLKYCLGMLFFCSCVSYAGDVESLAEEGWLLVETPHFRVFSDASKKSAKSFALDMELFSRALPNFVTGRLKSRVPKLSVFALKNQGNLKRLINTKDTAGLFISNNLNNYAIANLRYYSFNRKKQNFARQVLFHEYVHFYVANSNYTGRVPVWHSEGMADFLSTLRITNKEVVIGLVHEGRLRSLNPRKSVPIKKLFEATEYPESRREKNDFYNYAWLVYHFLFIHSEYQSKTEEFLLLFNQGVQVNKAFQQSYQMSYEEFGKIIKGYFGEKFRALGMTVNEPWNPEIQEPREVTPSKIAYELGQMMLAKGAPTEEASAEQRILAYDLMEYSLAKDPDNVSAVLALWSRGLKQVTESEEDDLKALGQQIKRLVDDNPDRSSVIRHYGDWFSAKADRAMSEYDDTEAKKYASNARGKYRAALALDRSNRQAFYALGNLYNIYASFLVVNDQEKQEYETVLRELYYTTSRLDYLFAVAIFLEQIGKKDQAVNDYRVLAQSSSKRLAKLATARLSALEQQNTE